MNTRIGIRLALACMLAACIASSGRAQQTVFNVPSPDVLDKSNLYLETDQYLRTWKGDDEEAALFFLRGVYGVGSNVEVGLNSGAFDYLHASEPFLDATVKWRPLRTNLRETGDPGALGLFLGNNLGVGLRGDASGDERDYAYAAGFVTLPDLQTTISAGPYYVTRDVFGDERVGCQLTLVQPVSWMEGLSVAGDWQSGDGAYATGGFILSRSPWTFYAAYGFANDGRDGDVLTLELGYGF
ncbi:MAG TPA: hypothetical protein VGR31_07425 [Planctomycetota bacterium]|jgi:hypothetical protein|nr:hypothetical protein [Planctomycetota bacterium]